MYPLQMALGLDFTKKILLNCHPGVQDEPRVELDAVGRRVPGLGRLRHDPPVAGADVEERSLGKAPSAAAATAERPQDVGDLRVGGGHVGQAELSQRGRDKGQANGAEGDRDTA